MPTSKVTRVRSDGFSKTSASEWPASGVLASRAFVRRLPLGGEAEQLLDLLAGEVRDREQVVHGVGCRRTSPTIATARSASFSSTISGGVMRRIFSPAVRTRRPRSRQASTTGPGRPVEIDADQEPLAPDLLDRREPGGEGAQPAHQVRSHPVGALGELVLQHRGEGRDAHRRGEGVAAERRAVGAGDHHARAGVPRHHRPDRDPAGQRLRERHHVGLDAPVLVRPEAPGAPHAGLDLVEHEERAALVAQPAKDGQVAVGRDVDPALALDRLDQDGRRPVVDRALHRLDVAERDVLEAGQQRLEAVLVLLVRRGGEGARASGRGTRPAS